MALIGAAAARATTHLSVATVKSSVSRLLDKLTLGNRLQLALLVRQADNDVRSDISAGNRSEGVRRRI